MDNTGNNMPLLLFQLHVRFAFASRLYILGISGESAWPELMSTKAGIRPGLLRRAVVIFLQYFGIAEGVSGAEKWVEAGWERRVLPSRCQRM